MKPSKTSRDGPNLICQVRSTTQWGHWSASARDLTGDKGTLGQVLNHHPDLLPQPLDTALSQVWGYASNVARHVEEGSEPNREEAELVVGLAAVVATYLTRNDQSL